MKKRILVLLLCACLFFGGAVTASGTVTQNNDLVSLSYLQNTYLNELNTMILQQVDQAWNSTKNQLLQSLNERGEGYIAKLVPQGTSEDGIQWLTAGSFTAQGGEQDDTITLAEGSGLIWTSGSASFSGTLIDLTLGQQLVNGQLVENHRYVAVTNTTVTVNSRVGKWSVEGKWLTTSDGINVPDKEFVDVPRDQWYYDPVYYVVGKGLFVGTSDTTFAPMTTINRGMLTTVLYRLAGSPQITYVPQFSDVLEGDWFAPGVIWAAQNGIAVGNVDGSFTPMALLTRQEIILMLYNYAVLCEYDTSARIDLTLVPDAASIAPDAVDAMSWAAATGILLGDGTNLMPEALTNRAQVATFLLRFEQWINQ